MAVYRNHPQSDCQPRTKTQAPMQLERYVHNPCTFRHAEHLVAVVPPQPLTIWATTQRIKVDQPLPRKRRLNPATRRLTTRSSLRKTLHPEVRRRNTAGGMYLKGNEITRASPTKSSRLTIQLDENNNWLSRRDGRLQHFVLMSRQGCRQCEAQLPSCVECC